MAQAPTKELSPGEVLLPAQEENTGPQEWQQDLNVANICPDCREVPPNLVEEFSSGDMVCASCGLVVGARIVDTRSEWRTFANDDQGNDDPSRVGAGDNPFLNGSQLHTSIQFSNDAKSKDLSRAQGRSTQHKSDKILTNAYASIARFAEKLDAPNTATDTAKQIFKQAVESNSFKNKNQEVLIASCLFIALRQNDVGRSFREIFNVTSVSKKEVGRTFKLLEEFLRKQRANGAGPLAGVSTSHSIVTQSDTSTDEEAQFRRYANQLNLRKDTVRVGVKLINTVRTNGVLAGRSPLSVAAACIFFVSHLMGEGKLGKDIGPLIHVSEGTIRTAYKLLYAKREELVDFSDPAIGPDSMDKLPSG